jgi:mono/diheme cytochrome c family protein
VLFAATTQQAVAVVVFLLVIAGWIAFIVATNRKAKPEVGAEIELAANRKPYLDDEQLEGPRLERVLLWGVLSLMVIGVGLPLYWITEPNRQAGAKEYFADRAAGDTLHHGQPVGGGALFAPTAEGGFNCAGCHGGASAIGGQVAYTLTDPDTGKLRQVQWKAPALNTATLRFTDDQLKDILTYGRPFSPMPAWGLDGGGPMNDQQITNLIAYLHKIQISKDDARKAATKAADDERQRLLGLGDSLAAAQAKLAAATTDDDRKTAQEAVDKIQAELAYNAGVYPTEGQALFNMNCARCHTLGWSYDEPRAPGSGAYGPPLYNAVNQFPQAKDQIDFVTAGRKRGERYGLNGQASGRMPHFGAFLTEKQIAAIVSYERSLGSTR